MKMYTFQKIDFNHLNRDEFDNMPNKSVLTTYDWISFIQEDSKANPYIIRISEESRLVGYFSGLITRKFGINILGSPFPGWSTPYMGLDLVNTAEKINVLSELLPFLKENSGCVYIQIIDRDFDYDELIKIAPLLNFAVEFSETLELLIDENNELQYKRMKTDCRNFIKQFERRGASIEEAVPNDEFAEEYYNQLIDVFAKQNLVPTYTVDKVKCLLRHLSKSNSVCCLRVRDPEGKSIATSIFPGFNKKMFFWGGASLRAYQHYRPNEYMIYRAMSYWRARGCTQFDMVGNRAYKKKFGSWEVHYPMIIYAKYSWLIPLKNLAAKLYYLSGNLLWKLHLKR